jgi:hypothetical protein
MIFLIHGKGGRRQWKLTFSFLLLLISLPIAIGHLYLSINHETSSSSAIQSIQICKLCPSPEREGSIIYGLRPKYGVKEYHITGGSDIFLLPHYSRP